MDPSLARRSFVGVLAATAAAGSSGLLQGAGPLAQSLTAPPPDRLRPFRFAHFTDVHCFAERRAPEGFAAALDHVQAKGQAAEMILTGGDLVFDSSETSLGEARDRWDLFNRILKERCRIPVEHCLGNHDVWGWCTAKCGSRGDEAEYGTGLARAQLKLGSEWRSFDRAGWHFIVLNSISPDPKSGCGYLARLNEAQRAWLDQDLAATSLPTVVVAHAPIMSISPAMSGKDLATADNVNQVSGGLLHLDGASLHQVFRKSGRVKLVLSGHLHQIDRCEAHGITYCCDGAVCGGWWKANANHAPPSYALIDLHPDGSFDHRVLEYGWKNA
ncbi:MAG: metallophosphoesterase [Phycisphaerae bacterium]|jgi:Icc protein|nr:metallophosphoesterase [Phycisphaerae bacterium]